jgi:hypothetical protein
MEVKFVSFDVNGLFVYDLRMSGPNDSPDPKYPYRLNPDGICVAIRADGRKCSYVENENGLCHIHNPNAKYFSQWYGEHGRRQKTVAPLVGDDSHLNFTPGPAQGTLF